MSGVHDHNRRAWDALVERRQRFTRPSTDECFDRPLAAVDGRGWLGGDVRGRRVLCLAAGGGRDGVLLAAAGAEVTVVDISPAMLALDRAAAAERGLNLRVVEASIDNLAAFAPASFEVVIQPVSSCYVPDVVAVYREVARVTVAGGLYVSQHKQPASMQAGTEPVSGGGYAVAEPYYRQGPLPEVAGSQHREEGTLEFLHRWENLVGGLCRAGFVVEDLVEPRHAKPDAAAGSFADRSRYLPPYVRIKARRVAHRGEGKTADGSAKLWIP
ncbi:MAG: class I SAM-dependent methyltransferase [Pirellulales bacterium]